MNSEQRQFMLGFATAMLLVSVKNLLFPQKSDVVTMFVPVAPHNPMLTPIDGGKTS